MQVQKQWELFGRYETGDVVVSIGSDSPVYTIREFDKLVFVNSVEQFSSVMTKTANSVEPAPYYDILSISSLFYLNISSAIVNVSGVTFNNSNKTLDFSDNSIPVGTQYSITGTRCPSYYMYMDFPQVRYHHHGSLLPKRVVLRKWNF
jgi:hypothetical protein